MPALPRCARTFADNRAALLTPDSSRIAYMIRLETAHSAMSQTLRTSAPDWSERPVEPKRLKSYRVRITSLSLRSVHGPTRRSCNGRYEDVGTNVRIGVTTRLHQGRHCRGGGR